MKNFILKLFKFPMMLLYGLFIFLAVILYYFFNTSVFVLFKTHLAVFVKMLEGELIPVYFDSKDLSEEEVKELASIIKEQFMLRKELKQSGES